MHPAPSQSLSRKRRGPDGDQPLSGAAAIVGIGSTEFSKNSGRTELQLACEAIVAALADAGIDPSEVDGLSTYTSETNGEASWLATVVSAS